MIPATFFQAEQFFFSPSLGLSLFLPIINQGFQPGSPLPYQNLLSKKYPLIGTKDKVPIKLEMLSSQGCLSLFNQGSNPLPKERMSHGVLGTRGSHSKWYWKEVVSWGVGSTRITLKEVLKGGYLMGGWGHNDTFKEVLKGGCLMGCWGHGEHTQRGTESETSQSHKNKRHMIPLTGGL